MSLTKFEKLMSVLDTMTIREEEYLNGDKDYIFTGKLRCGFQTEVRSPYELTRSGKSSRGSFMDTVLALYSERLAQELAGYDTDPDLQGWMSREECDDIIQTLGLVDAVAEREEENANG